MIVVIVLHGVYYVGFWTIKQATPGKMAIGAEIIDARSGAKPEFKNLVGRWLVFGVQLGVPILPVWLLFIRVGFEERKRGVHDTVAGTLVVHRDMVPEAT